MTCNRKYNFGFTLLEIMIVIAIIAVLMAILIPNMSYARQQAMLSSCESNERNLAAGLELYNTHYKRYPVQLTSLYPNYMRHPYCPSNQTDYGYETDPEGASFTIYCQGIHYLGLNNIDQGYPQYTPVVGLQLAVPAGSSSTGP